MNNSQLVDQQFINAVTPWLTPSSGSLRAHLTLAIRQAISTGHLQPGMRLPPERHLADALHVSRPTISGVIDDLRSAGLVESKQGSGTWVTTTAAPGRAAVPFVELLQSNGAIDLAAATAPDASLLPPIRIETADLLGAEPANGLSPLGLPELRRTVAQRNCDRLHGLEAENVVITSGAHQALALVVATLAPRGSTVLVEEPTYGGLVDMIRANGCVPVGIARDSDGPIPEDIGRLLLAHGPSIVILVSSVHSPTGTVSSTERNEQLAAVLAASDAVIVLDETYAELEFTPSGGVLSALLGHRALRVGSLSKTLWTGLRTGWIIGSEDVCTAIGRRRWEQFDLGPSVPAQLVAMQALRHIDDIVRIRRSDLQRKATLLAATMEELFPHWQANRVDGGLAMWVEIDVDGDAFALTASERGVSVLPGSACRVDRQPTNHIRICFDRPVDVLEAAFARLASAFT